MNPLSPIRGNIGGQPLDLRQLQEDWDREGLTAHIRLLRSDAAERSALAARLDRLTARFAYTVIAATAVLFAFHAGRYLIQWGALS